MTHSRYQLPGLLCAALTFSCAQAQTQGEEITSLNLSDKSVQLAYRTQAVGPGRIAEVSLLHHNENGQLASAGLQAMNKFSIGQLSLGGRLFGWDTDYRAGSALALGGTWSATVAQVSFPIGIELSAFYAPDVSSFNDATHLIDTSAQVYYQLIPNARAQVGYHFAEIGYDDDGRDQELDHHWYLGITLMF